MTTILLFRDTDGAVPFLEWFEALPDVARIRCRARLGLLADQGHELRRPAADYLRDGIHELRAKAGRVQYRVLYFFHGRQVVVLSHGLVKERSAVPEIEIERARRRKLAFESNPSRYTHGQRS